MKLSYAIVPACLAVLAASAPAPVATGSSSVAIGVPTATPSQYDVANKEPSAGGEAKNKRVNYGPYHIFKAKNKRMIDARAEDSERAVKEATNSDGISARTVEEATNSDGFSARNEPSADGNAKRTFAQFGDYAWGENNDESKQVWF